MPKIKVSSVVYHRNGVGGEGFYAVHFMDPSETLHPFVAVLPSSVIPDEGAAPKWSPLCYVVTPSAPEDCWRGDYYSEQIIKAVMGYRDAREGALHDRPD